MGILEEIHEQLSDIYNRLGDMNPQTIVDDTPAEPDRPPTAKEKAAEKKAAKAAAAKAAKAAAKGEMSAGDFNTAVKALAKDHRDIVKKARDEMFDPDMKLRDVPAEERQNFLDRVGALVEEDDL